MNRMIGRLGQTHFGIVPSELYDRLDARSGGGGATTGIDARVLGQAEAVVVWVSPGSAAEFAGVRPGWTIRSVNGTPTAPIIAEITKDFSKSTLYDIAASRAIERLLSGPAGSSANVEIEDAAGSLKIAGIPRQAPRGAVSTFGHLPAQHVWIDTRKIGNAGYQMQRPRGWRSTTRLWSRALMGAPTSWPRRVPDGDASPN